MRPIKLTMQAFGPYSGREVVDFTELQEKNLFLVTGPTGSGKTTIFDAISYAMYGESSGNIRTGESLRSQFASQDLPTEVELEFELKGLTYQVKRSPSQERKKRRSEGYTVQAASAELIIEGEAKPAAGIRSVNQKIEAAIGINADQFRQIMMIPQGEFRKLLLSDSEDREKVLQKLFDTHLYRHVQGQLDGMAKDLSRDIRSQTDLRDHEIRKIHAGDHEGLRQLLENGTSRVMEIIEAVEDKNRMESKKVESLDKEIQETAQAIDRQIEAREAAKHVNQQFDSLAAAEKEAAALQAQAEKIEALKAVVTAAEKAKDIQAAEGIYLEQVEEDKRKQGLIEENANALAAAEKVLAEAKVKWDQQTSEAAQKERELIGDDLKRQIALQDKVARIEIEEAAEKALDGQRREVETEIGKLVQTAADTLAQGEQARMEREEAQKAKLERLEIQSKIRDQVEENKSIKAYLDACEGLKAKEASLVRSQKQMEKTLAAFQRADELHKRRQLNFFRNQAAILAQALEEGQPCPVCGSIHHEKKAAFVGESVTEDMLKESEAAKQEAEEKKNKQETKLALAEEAQVNLLEEVQKAEAQIAEILDFEGDGLDQRVEACQLRLDEGVEGLTVLEKAEKDADKRIQKAEGIDSRIQALDKALQEANAKKSQAEARLVELAGKLAASHAVLKELYGDVPEALRTMQSLQASMEALEKAKEEKEAAYRKAREAYESAVKERDGLHSKGTHLQEEQKVCSQQVKVHEEAYATQRLAAGFESELAYQAAKCKEEVLKSHRKEIEDYQLEVYALEERTQALKKDLDGKAKADIEEFNTSINIMKMENDTRISMKSRMEKEVEDNQKILTEVKAINQDIEKKAKRYQLVGDLAGVASGKNPAKITFERYVLAAFLEDILEAANIRLYQMSQGRYQLFRTDELERKNKQSGLELKVFDQYTGKHRHVKTLSGGEGFMASLSMALGLSDVVQSYAGGVQLDTMFIDEGFGTLDQEALDGAINCLVDLQKSGRLIGIISHVQELKERIETRLEVTSGPTGSSAVFVV